jgi:DNA-binding transcriptional LysR family regulator
VTEPDLVLNVSRLRVLRELALRGTIAAVAEALWMTPSAVSQQLSALERETGFELVERAGRGVRLTAAGRVLAEHSERVFQALDEAKSALRALQSEPAGRVRIASFPSVVRLVIPQMLASLRERHPRLQLEVEDLEGEQGLDAVRLGHVDLAVIDDLTWSMRAPTEGLSVSELFVTPLVVVFAKDHPWAERDESRWIDLDGRPFVTEQRASVFTRSVEDACRRAGARPVVRARVHDAAATLALVGASEMVAVLPQSQMTDQTSAVRWRVLEPVVERRLLVVTRVGQSASPAVGAALAALTEATVQLR